MLYSCFASCPKHTELLLKDELIAFGCENVQEKLAGVRFDASAQQLMFALRWSRIANRIMLHLTQHKVANKNDLYECIFSIDWSAQLNTRMDTLSVRFVGTNGALKNTMFSQQVCKDAVCDQLQRGHSYRPRLVKSDANLHVYCRLKYNQLDVYQDITGHSLHLRGYKTERTAAPLKENLAAAILMRAEWPERAQHNYNLIDPMCGSGTFLSEGWMMACDVAVNLNFESRALSSWSGYDANLWQQQKEQAIVRKQEGVERFKGQIIGVDHHKESIEKAQENIARLSSKAKIQCQYQTLEKFKIPPRNNLIVCNPPYGVRLQKNTLQSWKSLSSWLSQRATGAMAYVLTPDSSKGFLLGFRATKVWALMNGNLDIQLRAFNVTKDNQLDCPEDQHFALPAAAQMLANRLKKNRKVLSNWVESNNVQAWRLYDADLPEFSLAIDMYKQFVHLQEYQAPKSISEKKAKQRLELGLLAVQSVIQPDRNKISVKTRQKQKGSSQYSVLGNDTQDFVIEENNRKYKVNLFKYLDTGLFLDHRWLRNEIQSLSKGLDVLNLFSYTGSITVAAASGGAASSISVDTSKTYLRWAEDNLRLNNLDTKKHQMVRSDVEKYLQENVTQFDLIVLDPPTFSNSHSREKDWNVQTDHYDLLLLCQKRLKPEGVIFFSNNYKKFRLDQRVNDAFKVEDITQQSLDDDFKNSHKAHHCFKLIIRE